MASAQRAEIPGSTRDFEAEHRRIGDVDAGRQIQVTVYLRPSQSLDWVDQPAASASAERRTLTREELSSGYGASDADIAAVRSFADEYGLEVAAVDQGRRAVALTGTVDAVAHAFGAEEVGLFEHPQAGAYRARRGPLTVPQPLAGVITGVFGIDERPQAMPHLRRHRNQAAPQAYTPIQVATAYGFPSGVNGDGETVAILELGGGFSQTDLDTYFQGLGIAAPTVTAVGVDGGSNSPGTDQNADGEVMLDIEVVGAVASGAKIVVYFAPNTDQGFIDAVSNAVHDAANKPSVLSISWGGPEDSWTGQARSQMEQVFTEAAAAGVTVTVAAGDNGSTDGVKDGKQHVDFPASAPHALACGGTSLQINNGQIAGETVWNDGQGGGAGGGGISIAFPVPAYQTATHMPTNLNTGQPGRGVPDVAGDADPQTGYTILVDGNQETIGGTSAVAPLWAGLTALINQSMGKAVGFMHPQLYAAGAKPGFHDITQGNNGDYQAGPGWDACTGLGSPDGVALLHVLDGSAPAAQVDRTALAGVGSPPKRDSEADMSGETTTTPGGDPAIGTINELAAASRRLLEESFNQGNLGLADELVAPDAVNHDPATPPELRGLRGPEVFKRTVSMYRAAFPDVQMTIDDVIAADDKVVLRWQCHGTHRGELAGLAPTGARASVTGVNIDRWRDGKVVEQWAEWDNLGLARQLGAAPPEGSVGEKLGTAVQRMMARRMRAKNQV